MCHHWVSAVYQNDLWPSRVRRSSFNQSCQAQSAHLSHTEQAQKLYNKFSRAMTQLDLERPKRTPRGPSPQKTQATRRTIVAAAFEEFLEHGYARGTTASVAQRAGLSKVTLFRYFDSKDALFEAVIQTHIASAAVALQSSPMLEHESVGEYLLRTVGAAAEVIDSSGRSATARLVIAEGLEFPLLAQMYRRYVNDALLEHFSRLAQLAAERGELKAPELIQHPALLLAPLWMAMMNNTVIHPEVPMNAKTLFQLQVALLFKMP